MTEHEKIVEQMTLEQLTGGQVVSFDFCKEFRTSYTQCAARKGASWAVRAMEKEQISRKYGQWPLVLSRQM